MNKIDVTLLELLNMLKNVESTMKKEKSVSLLLRTTRRGRQTSPLRKDKVKAKGLKRQKLPRRRN